jgi:hypothetical protein
LRKWEDDAVKGKGRLVVAAVLGMLIAFAIGGTGALSNTTPSTDTGGDPGDGGDGGTTTNITNITNENPCSGAAYCCPTSNSSLRSRRAHAAQSCDPPPLSGPDRAALDRALASAAQLRADQIQKIQAAQRRYDAELAALLAEAPSLVLALRQEGYAPAAALLQAAAYIEGEHARYRRAYLLAVARAIISRASARGTAAATPAPSNLSAAQAQLATAKAAEGRAERSAVRTQRLLSKRGTRNAAAFRRLRALVRAHAPKGGIRSAVRAWVAGLKIERTLEKRLGRLGRRLAHAQYARRTAAAWVVYYR